MRFWALQCVDVPYQTEDPGEGVKSDVFEKPNFNCSEESVKYENPNILRDI